MLSKKNKVEDIILPNLKLYYKVIVIKTAWYWQKKKKKDTQTNETKQKTQKQIHTSRVNSFSTKLPRTYIGEKSLFNKQCWENWISICKRMKLDLHLLPYAKIKSKQIKDLNLRPQTVKLLQEDIRETLQDIDLVNDFIGTNPQAHTPKQTRTDRITSS